MDRITRPSWEPGPGISCKGTVLSFSPHSVGANSSCRTKRRRDPPDRPRLPLPADVSGSLGAIRSYRAVNSGPSGPNAEANTIQCRTVPTRWVRHGLKRLRYGGRLRSSHHNAQPPTRESQGFLRRGTSIMSNVPTYAGGRNRSAFSPSARSRSPWHGPETVP